MEHNKSLMAFLIQHRNSSQQSEQDSSDNHSPTAMCVAVYNILLCVFTVPSNSVLLLILCRDPLKCFRNASSFLVISMTLANLVTGLILEPLTATSSLAEYYNIAIPKMFLNFHKGILGVAPNASFFSLFALSLDAYIAASRPLKYKYLVTKRNSIICILTIWAYSTAFSLAQFTGVTEEHYWKLDLYLNTTTIFILLFTSYTGLIKSLQENKKRALTLHPVHSAFQESLGRKLNKERTRRSLKTVLVLIIIHTLTIVPNMISWLLFHNCPSCKEVQGFSVTLIVLRYMAYLKFAVDPIVYFWLMPRYRLALKMATMCSAE